MSLPTFATQTVTVWRAPTITDHGVSVRDWANAVSHDLTDVSVQPGTGSVDRLGRVNAVTTVYTVFAESGADVLDSDRVEIDSIHYDVDGPIRKYRTGVLDHDEIPLKAVT